MIASVMQLITDVIEAFTPFKPVLKQESVKIKQRMGEKTHGVAHLSLQSF